MRKTVTALVLSAAAASSLVLAGSAHAATRTAERPADRPVIPGYECLFRGPAPLIFPPIINGRLCSAVNGAPEGGLVRGPVMISIRGEEVAWICRFADAYHYPEAVIGRDCFPEGEGPA